MLTNKTIKMTNWKDISEPPKLKPIGFSEQVIVHYPSIPNEKVETYGIAYYHPDPPYNGVNWVDFANYGRMPDRWCYIPS